MDIVLKPSGSQNIVVRPQGRPVWYPASTVEPSTVQVWWRAINADGTVGVWHFWGSANPGAGGSWPWNPLADQKIEVSLNPVNAFGVPKYRGPDDAVRATVLMQRITAAPTLQKYGTATVNEVSIGIDSGADKDYVRKIRVSYAETLSGGGALVSPTVLELNYADGGAPDAVDIVRSGEFVPLFQWRGTDPTANGFTKTGSAPVDLNSPGWRINSVGRDDATYYSKSSWPVGAFSAGFSLDTLPPLVLGSDVAAGAVSLCAGVTVDDGTYRYALAFSNTAVSLNGGAEHSHGGSRVRLVITAGGATADLWVGSTKVETATAGAATVASGLRFGDLVTTDDAAVTWFDLKYALTPEPVTLSQDLYATVALSGGGAYGAESAVLPLTFGADAIITTTAPSTGSSADNFDEQPRGKINFDTGSVI